MNEERPLYKVETQLVSDEINEIISRKNHWMVRNGNFIFLGLLACAVIAAKLIRYPDIIPGSATILSTEPVAEIRSGRGGKLIAIFGHENMEVAGGDIIGYTDHEASYRNMQRLALTADSARSFIDKKESMLPALSYQEPDSLGELTGSYHHFISLYHSSAQGKGTAEQLTQLQMALQDLELKLKAWKDNYLLIAPRAGTLSFLVPVMQGQELKPNQVIGIVRPENTEFYATMNIQPSIYRLVDTGQVVLLKFHSYPFQEYGLIKGNLTSLAGTASDSGYQVRVSFSNELETTHGKRIPYKTGMEASAEIVLRNMSLLDRLIGYVKKK